MALSVVRELQDGTTELLDDADGVQFTLKAGQWDEIAHLPESEKRHRAEQFTIANRRDTSRDRSASDEQAMDFARDSASGEAHQEQERGPD